jgi:hypothetical protein
VPHDANRPRLKGLDEMPQPGRTLRQRYFSIRAKLKYSKRFGWAWPLLQLVLFVFAVWLIAWLCGYPLGRAFQTILGRFRHS